MGSAAKKEPNSDSLVSHLTRYTNSCDKKGKDAKRVDHPTGKRKWPIMTLSPLFYSLLVLATLSLPVHAQEPPVNAERGKELFTLHCARCHGMQGHGDGPDAGTLIVPPTNFHRAESRVKSDMDLRSAIIWGLAFSPMHGWWDTISVQDIRLITAYIRQLAPYTPSSP